jgi:putative nucleotidyltransferase with HDIG domain
MHPGGGQEGMSKMNSAIPISPENNYSQTGIFPAEKINGIYDLCRQLVSTNMLDVLLDSIVRKTVEILRVKFCRILILEPDGHFHCQASCSPDAFDASQLKWRRALPQAQAFYQRVVLGEAPVFIGQGNQLSGELRFALRLSYTDSLCLIPMRVNQEAVGILALGEEHRSAAESVLKEKIHLAVLIANQAASAVYRARLSCRLEESQLQTVLALAKVMESRDSYIGGHSRKVTAMAVRLAQKFNCTPAEVQAIRWGALLHDIGKVGIRDGILRKTGSLNKKEWQQMRRHPESGAEIVRMAPNMDYVASIILAHHERYDGSGYPYGLQRDMIPFGARILAVSDAFSAITDDRPYRLSSTEEEAVLEIKRCSGSQFDPRVVDAFVSLFQDNQEHTNIS